jgi:hypothetical protein
MKTKAPPGPSLEELCSDYLLTKGATTDHDCTDYRYVWHYKFVLETRLGPLGITPHEDWIACMFEDVEKARSVLPHGFQDRLNRHSGKWNWNWSGFMGADPDERRRAFGDFVRELEKLL